MRSTAALGAKQLKRLRKTLAGRWKHSNVPVNGVISTSLELSDEVIKETALFRSVVQPPPRGSLREWITINTIDFYNQANTLYTALADHCTNDTCPIMTAGDMFEVYWADGSATDASMEPSPTHSVSAPDYITHLFDWAYTQLAAFPTDGTFPDDFDLRLETIHRRLLRVYIHMYRFHSDSAELLDGLDILRLRVRHYLCFVTEYNLIGADQLLPMRSFFLRTLGIDVTGSTGTPDNSVGANVLQGGGSKSGGKGKGGVAGAGERDARVFGVPLVQIVEYERAELERVGSSGARRGAINSASTGNLADAELYNSSGKGLSTTQPPASKHGLSHELHTTVSDGNVGAVTSLDDTYVPQIVQKCIRALEGAVDREGIFRISGSVRMVKELTSAFDNDSMGLQVNIDDHPNGEHVIAGALKQFFRELPEPLLSFSLYDQWIATASEPNAVERMALTKRLLHKLSLPAQATLAMLLRFLCFVGSNAEKNLMSADNLAVVFAPGLLRPPEGTDARQLFSDAAVQQQVVVFLINHSDRLFPGSTVQSCTSPRSRTRTIIRVRPEGKELLHANVAGDSPEDSARRRERLRRRAAGRSSSDVGVRRPMQGLTVSGVLAASESPVEEEEEGREDEGGGTTGIDVGERTMPVAEKEGDYGETDGSTVEPHPPARRIASDYAQLSTFDVASLPSGDLRMAFALPRLSKPKFAFVEDAMEEEEEKEEEAAVAEEGEKEKEKEGSEGGGAIEQEKKKEEEEDEDVIVVDESWFPGVSVALADTDTFNRVPERSFSLVGELNGPDEGGAHVPTVGLDGTVLDLHDERFTESCV